MKRILVSIFIFVIMAGTFVFALCKHNSDDDTVESLYQFDKYSIYNELLFRQSHDIQVLSGFDVTKVKREESLMKYSSDTLYQALLDMKTRKHTLQYNKTRNKHYAIKVLYGSDDRKEPYELTDSSQISNARKVACLILSEQLINNYDGTYTLKISQTYKQANNLCDEEAFSNQSILSYCSGFAYKSNKMITAGHCIEDYENMLDKIRFIYGYGYYKKDTINLIIPARDIYIPQRIVNSASYKQNDIAIIEVISLSNSSIPADRIVKYNTQKSALRQKCSVYTIGYPGGLPLKITINGKVIKDNEDQNTVITNLDTYRGNSGSPVFNYANDKVEGVLLKGNDDYYVILDKCNRSFICPEDIGNCTGEEVKRLSVVLTK